ncbi:MAG: FAD-binding oxidoreductase [Gaiellaceae bacterium MAG52_C11]|nr:FAD-binding oxidoreductase [Candidatus Gaiellasilicea maunaloa]
MATDAADVAVVGAGIVGLAVARALRERGASVIVCERTGIGSGQSGVQPGGVRRQWGTATGCRLATESFAFWREAQSLLESPVELRFRECGYLFVAHSEPMLARLRANVAIQNAEGVPSRIVDPTQAADLVPGLRTKTLSGAAWCAQDGYFDRPQAVVEAFARDADVRLGEVTELRRAAGGWEVLSGSGVVSAASVVLAAGVDSAPLAAEPGMTLPLEREERHLFLSVPIADRLVEPLVVSIERSFAAKQLADGRVLASDLAATGDAAAGAPRWRARVREGIRELLPVLEYVDFPILASGAYDVTPDRQPILGPLGDGLYVAAGFSGHGFMIAPAVARILADAVEGRLDPILDVLDLARFQESRLLPEPQVV